MVNRGCAEKTIYGAMILAKQAFQWGKLREYRSGNAKVAKAKALPQPCFGTDQVGLLIANSEAYKKAAIATLGYFGIRIGELEHLQWFDVKLERSSSTASAWRG